MFISKRIEELKAEWLETITEEGISDFAKLYMDKLLVVVLVSAIRVENSNYTDMSLKPLHKALENILDFLGEQEEDELLG